jgi:cytochrome d ubiquinol oxidase subunit II
MANIICLVALFGFSIFPELVYSTGVGQSLSIEDAASSAATLRLMLLIALIGIPLIVAYTTIVYWTFRQPIPID